MKQTEQDLYNRLATLYGEVMVLNEDIKQLKKDFTFNKKTNLDGLPKSDVAETAGAAKIKAQNDYEEKRVKVMALFKKFEELEGYNE
jgi:hypothetical protein